MNYIVQFCNEYNFFQTNKIAKSFGISETKLLINVGYNRYDQISDKVAAYDFMLKEFFGFYCLGFLWFWDLNGDVFYKDKEKLHFKQWNWTAQA